jgi:hypothetical protein
MLPVIVKCCRGRVIGPAETGWLGKPFKRINSLSQIVERRRTIYNIQATSAAD